MPYWCSAFGCTNESGRPNPDDPAKKISFHKFPKDAVTRQRWIADTHRKNFDPGPHATLCSDHFADESFVPGLTRRKLYPNAVPSIFNELPNYYQPPSKRKSTALEKRAIAKSLAVASNEDAPTTSAAITTSAVICHLICRYPYWWRWDFPTEKTHRWFGEKSFTTSKKIEKHSDNPNWSQCRSSGWIER